MCCYKKSKVEQRIRNRAKNTGEIEAIKSLFFYVRGKSKTINHLTISAESSVIGYFKWKEGRNSINPIQVNNLREKGYDLNNPRGLHVFIPPRYKKNRINIKRSQVCKTIRGLEVEVLIPVICKMEHFVRAGYGNLKPQNFPQAVFTEVTIAPKIWKEVIRLLINFYNTSAK